jgi:hypothetical protein
MVKDDPQGTGRLMLISDSPSSAITLSDLTSGDWQLSSHVSGDLIVASAVNFEWRRWFASVYLESTLA